MACCDRCRGAPVACKGENGSVAKLSTVVLGKIVRTVRERRGISREELAEAVGKSARWVYRVESGKQRLSVEGLFEVAVGLNTSVLVLVSSCCRALGTQKPQR